MNQLTIVNYHYIRDFKNSRYPNLKGCDKQRFLDHVTYIKDHYVPVTMQNVIDAIDKKTELPPKSCMLTFDDGYREHFTVAYPVLEYHGMKGNFYVCTKDLVSRPNQDMFTLLDVNKIHLILQSKIPAATLCKEINHFISQFRQFSNQFNLEHFLHYSKKYKHANAYDNAETVYVKRMLQTGLPFTARKVLIERLFFKYAVDAELHSKVHKGRIESMIASEFYMDYIQLKTMVKAGHHVGGHTTTHPHLADLKKDDQDREIYPSYCLSSAQLGQKFDTFCYPYGSHNQDTKDLLKIRNFKLAFGVESRIANLDKDDLFNLPRLDCNDFDKIVYGR